MPAARPVDFVTTVASLPGLWRRKLSGSFRITPMAHKVVSRGRCPKCGNYFVGTPDVHDIFYCRGGLTLAVTDMHFTLAQNQYDGAIFVLAPYNGPIDKGIPAEGFDVGFGRIGTPDRVKTI